MKESRHRYHRIEFREAQKFGQWWFWLILAITGLIPLYGIYKQLILGKEFGNNPASDLGLVIIAISVFGLIVLIRLVKLETEIDRDGIGIRFFPFFQKEFKWEDIAGARVVNYGLQEGWGIRLGTKFGTLYNISGKMGLALEMKSGKKYCIGTQKEDELKRIVEKYQPVQYEKGKYR